MKLIPEWKKAWRYMSMHVASVAIVFGLLPQDTQASMLEVVGVPANRITAVLGLIFMFARIVQVKQPKA